ncbi:hypothetical protein J6TS2_38160 [Heyndrickxia sporothermodurans]|nr:hypothetical protein J6TS2_38160 [Heyndrickxia sporothermodurans]
MMNTSFKEIEDTIPWQRLTTAYGRGTDIPRLIESGQFVELVNLIEHQSTLWQVTPWVLLVLLRKLAKKEPKKVTMKEINLYLTVASTIEVEIMESQNRLEKMANLLDEKYLWPENEGKDEEWWEEDEPPGYTRDVFISYYYFSYILLKKALPVFNRIKNDNNQLASSIQELLLLLGSK